MPYPSFACCNIHIWLITCFVWYTECIICSTFLTHKVYCATKKISENIKPWSRLWWDTLTRTQQSTKALFWSHVDHHEYPQKAASLNLQHSHTIQYKSTTEKVTTVTCFIHISWRIYQARLMQYMHFTTFLRKPGILLMVDSSIVSIRMLHTLHKQNWIEVN